MITDDLLLMHNYREIQISPFDSQYVIKKFQKKFVDDVGIKYFINAKKYKGFKWNNNGAVWEFTISFSIDDKFINSVLFHWESIDEVEDKVEEMWQKCNFDYYEKFERQSYETTVAD